MLRKLKTLIFKGRAKAVIFDYDGVLNDSLLALRTVWNEFYKRGLSKKYFETDAEFSNAFQGDPKKNLLCVGVREENLSLCDKVIRETLPGLDKDMKLYPGVWMLISMLKQDGYKIGIVSNGIREAIEYKIKKYSLEDCVDSIVGHDDVANPKPSPEGILKCMEQLKVKPSKTIYVGDMESDVKAAKTAKVRLMIAATYGYLSLAKNQQERLKGADVFADSPRDIYHLVKNG